MPALRAGPVDTMSAGGAVSFSESAKAHHPVEAIVDNAPQHAWDSKIHAAERTFGMHMGLRMRMDRAILSRVQRGPGLKSEMVGLETLLGQDTNLEWEDVLGDPFERPEMPSLGLHAIMERRLGL